MASYDVIEESEPNASLRPRLGLLLAKASRKQSF